MIQAHELRIGNILEYYLNEDGIEWSATTIDAQDISDCDVHNKEFNQRHRPIHITPKVLAACGFVQGDGDPNKTYGTVFSIAYKTEYGQRTYAVFNCPYGNWSAKHADRHIKYLHQLQNLYYCFTGHELPVKIEEL